MLLVGWPAVVDDDGTGTTGTVINKALTDAVKASVEDQVHSAVNPATKPNAVTDEVVTARGTTASLGARLDVSHNADGTPKPVAGQASEAQLVSFAAGNWIQNDDFLIWHLGDAAAPTGYALAGAAAAVARCGTGLADTNTKVGPFCAKVTRAAADATLSQYLLNTTSYAAAGECLDARSFSFGCWVKCSVANMARVRLYDGATSTASDYHTGDGTWQFLGDVHVVSGAASELTLILEVKNSAGDAYFSGATALPGLVALTDWAPCPKVYGAACFEIGGTVTTGDDKKRFRSARPGLMKDVVLTIITGPTGQALIADVDVYDGGAWDTPYTTRPEIAAAAAVGGAIPDNAAKYRYRCIPGAVGATLTGTIRLNIDQVGSVVAGSDLFAAVRIMQYARPQENLLAYNDGTV